MALRPVVRRLSLAAIILGVVFAIVAAGLASSREGGCAAILGIVALLCFAAAWPLWRRVFRRAPPPQYQRDVLEEDLGFDVITELEGVQFAVLLLPDEIAPPANGVLAIVLQNAHATPREFTLTISKSPFRMAREEARVRLEGGQVRLVTIPFATMDFLEGREAVVKYATKVESTDDSGARVIRRKGLPGLHAGGRKYAMSRVAPPGSPAGAGANLGNLSLDAVLYQTGWPAPDLAPVNGLLKED
jgi:hypothetical protein